MGEKEECLTLLLTQFYSKSRVGDKDTICKEINLNTPVCPLVSLYFIGYKSFPQIFDY